MYAIVIDSHQVQLDWSCFSEKKVIRRGKGDGTIIRKNSGRVVRLRFSKKQKTISILSRDRMIFDSTTVSIYNSEGEAMSGIEGKKNRDTSRRTI